MLGDECIDSRKQHCQPVLLEFLPLEYRWFRTKDQSRSVIAVHEEAGSLIEDFFQ